ncbi:MAG: DUF2301 domain-containing membrane protein [bacterium]
MSQADVYYPKSYDITYRIGYVIGFIGIFIFMFSYIFNSLNYILLGLAIFEAGTLLSGIFLLVWKKEVKIFILSCIVIGILLGSVSFYFFNFNALFKDISIIISIGFVLAGLGGLYGKEAHCFHFYEGWILLWSFPILILLNLIVFISNIQFNPAVHLIFSIIYFFIMLLALSFLIKKIKQPLMQYCQN